MTALKVGFALTGSFCTFERIIKVMQDMIARGYDITPILSDNAAKTDTRFGTAAHWYSELASITSNHIIDSITTAEPIGPKAMFDVLVVAPCTGNTLAKLAASVTDTTVTMAAKSHLRGGKPIILGISTNDGLSGSAANIGSLLNRKHYYFVPFRQDAPLTKPCSLVAEMERIPQTIQEAMEGKQLQPMLLTPALG